MKKFIRIACLILLVVMLLASSVFGATKTISIKDESGTAESFKFNNGNGSVTQEITEIDNDLKEITVKTSVVNNEEEKKYDEIVFVIDASSSSWRFSYYGDRYYDRFIEMAKSIGSNILENNENARVGVVLSYGRTFQFNYELRECTDDTLNMDYYDVEVIDEYDTPVELAPKVQVSMTNNIGTFNSKISEDTLAEVNTGDYTIVLTNIQAGVQKAETMFSNNARTKSILVFSDGTFNEDAEGNYFAPVEDSNYPFYQSPEWDELVIKESDTQIVYSNIITPEKESELHDLIYGNYFEEIEKINNNNIFLKAILNGTNFDMDLQGLIPVNPPPGAACEFNIVNTLAEESIGGGTPALSLSYILNEHRQIPEIEQSFLDDYGEFVSSVEERKTGFSLTNVLSDEILENYELIDVKKPSNGIAKANTENTLINWDIDELTNGKTETLEFKLKLKATYNDESFKSISKISKSMTFTFANDEPVVVNPVVAIKGNEIVHVSNPQTGDTIRKYAEIFSVALGIYLISRFMRKYGTKKKKINF